MVFDSVLLKTAQRLKVEVKRKVSSQLRRHCFVVNIPRSCVNQNKTDNSCPINLATYLHSKAVEQLSNQL